MATACPALLFYQGGGQALRVYPRSSRDQRQRWLLTVVIMAGVAILACFFCWFFRPPEQSELVEITGVFERLETSTTHTRASSHTTYILYLTGEEQGYRIDSCYCGFAGFGVTGIPGKSRTCTAVTGAAVFGADSRFLKEGGFHGTTYLRCHRSESTGEASAG